MRVTQLTRDLLWMRRLSKDGPTPALQDAADLYQWTRSGECPECRQRRSEWKCPTCGHEFRRVMGNT